MFTACRFNKKKSVAGFRLNLTNWHATRYCSSLKVIGFWAPLPLESPGEDKLFDRKFNPKWYCSRAAKFCTITHNNQRMVAVIKIHPQSNGLSPRGQIFNTRNIHARCLLGIIVIIIIIVIGLHNDTGTTLGLKLSNRQTVTSIVYLPWQRTS